MESGNWKLETGNWKLETGVWKLELGNWKIENGKWKLETGIGKLEFGNWNWKTGIGNLNLEFDAWNLTSLFIQFLVITVSAFIFSSSPTISSGVLPSNLSAALASSASW